MTDGRRAKVASGFEALNRQDFEAVLATMHPDVESRVVEPLVNAGTWHGPEGVAAMMSAWVEPWSELHNEVLEISLPDERNAIATVRQTATGEASGVPVTLDVHFVFEFRDDLIVRLEIHPDRGSALAAL